MPTRRGFDSYFGWWSCFLNEGVERGEGGGGVERGVEAVVVAVVVVVVMVAAVV